MPSYRPPLDAEQLAAVKAYNGPVKIDACAGAGKTTCLVEHIDYLLDHGIPEKDIVAFTFTRNAANEMLSRSGLSKSTLRTIHSWALAAVKQEYANFTPPLRSNPLLINQYEILRPIIKHLDLDYKEMVGYISKCKRRGLSPADALKEAQENPAEIEGAVDYAIGYKRYEEGCRALQVVDFDSLIIELIRLFEENSEICDRHQVRFLLLDEAQDCAAVDWQLIKLITRRHGNLWAVGDINQCVYEFRGANPDLFADFEKMFPGGRVYPISTNYRSTEEIVEYSKIVAPEKTAYLAKLTAFKKGGLKNEYAVYKNDGDECEQILKLIQGGLAITETAILARTNAQLGLIQGVCAAKNIPYILLGKGNFWKKPEVLGLLSFARHTQHPNDDNTRGCIRAPFECNKFYAKKDDIIDSLQGMGEIADTSMFHCMARHDNEAVRRLYGILTNLRRAAGEMKPDKFMWYMAEQTGALDLAETKENEESESFVDENIRKVLGIAGMFRTMPEFINFTLTAGRSSNKKARLILSTVHGFKGMQARNVFVIGVNEELFPHVKSPLKEEQRLYYVAITRPAERLFVSACEAPSEFLTPMLPKPGAVVTAPDPWAGFKLVGKAR